MADKEVPLNRLSPSKRTRFLKNFFSSGGTPPAYEQSARADIMAYLQDEEDLPTRTIEYHFRRRLKRDN
jgi:hypothetical protein